MNIFTKEELELAWERLLNDLRKNRVFANYFYEKKLYSIDTESWIDEVLGELNSGTFSPSPSIFCDVPKPGHGIRPGKYINYKDRLVYYAILGKIIPTLKDVLKWSDKKVDYANSIRKDINASECVVNGIFSWGRFRRKCKKLLENTAYTHIVFTDITGYYENIDINTLTSELRQVGVPNTITQLLSVCLKRWGVGLPQGYVPSDLLSKFYLNIVDQKMKSLGYEYLRYSDDFRIFCKSNTEAKMAIRDLIVLLRNRCLNLQSAKTNICLPDDALTKIDGVNPLLEKTVKKYADEILSRMSPDDPYVTSYEEKILEIASNPYSTVYDYSKLAEEMGVSESTEVFKQAFSDYFLSTSTDFHHTLFRFLLTMLGRQKDPFAINYCVSILVDRPEETSFILKYFSSIDNKKEIVKSIVQFLKSNDCIYEYQVFQILNWYASICKELPSKGMLLQAKKYSFNFDVPFYLRSVSRKIVSEIGSGSDLEDFVSQYPRASGLDQTEILISYKRIEKGRRNMIIKSAMGDHEQNHKVMEIILQEESQN